MDMLLKFAQPSFLVGESSVFFLCTPSCSLWQPLILLQLKVQTFSGTWLRKAKNGKYKLSFLGTWLDTGDDDDDDES